MRYVRQLAAYEAEERTENLVAAARAVPTYAPLFQENRQTSLEPLHQALTNRDPQRSDHSHTCRYA